MNKKKRDEEGGKPSNKVVVFDVTQVDAMARKRLVSLCKRAGIRANQTNDEMKSALKAYHNAHNGGVDVNSNEKQPPRYLI